MSEIATTPVTTASATEEEEEKPEDLGHTLNGHGEGWNKTTSSLVPQGAGSRGVAVGALAGVLGLAVFVL